MTFQRLTSAPALLTLLLSAGPVFAQEKPPPASDQSATVAREVLSREMASPDTYPRWFALRAAQGLSDKKLASAARHLARSDDRYERSLALEFLASADPAGSRQEFLDALDAPFRSVRLRGLHGLSLLKDPRLVTRLSRLLHEDADPDLRALAARALAGTGSSDARPALHEALDDAVSNVRHEAVRALVALHDDKIVSVIGRRLREAPAEQRPDEFRLAALVPDRSLLPVLRPFLDDADPQVRAFAAAAVLAIVEQTANGHP